MRQPSAIVESAMLLRPRGFDHLSIPPLAGHLE